MMIILGKYILGSQKNWLVSHGQAGFFSYFSNQIGQQISAGLHAATRKIPLADKTRVLGRSFDQQELTRGVV